MVDPNDKYKRRQVGARLNSFYAYKADGFFNSDEEAQAWMNKYASQEGYPFGTNKFKGGDLIYQDTNNDGKMTEDDRVLLGSTDPAWTFGLNLNAGYKGFDLSLMFSGAADVSRMFAQPGDFNGDMSHPTTAWLDAWTPENKDAKCHELLMRRNLQAILGITCLVSGFKMPAMYAYKIYNLDIHSQPTG